MNKYDGICCRAALFARLLLLKSKAVFKEDVEITRCILPERLTGPYSGAGLVTLRSKTLAGFVKHGFIELKLLAISDRGRARALQAVLRGETVRELRSDILSARNTDEFRVCRKEI